MIGGTRRQIDRKRSNSSKNNNTSLATNKKNDRTHKNKNICSKEEVRRTRATRSCRNVAKKTDGVEESENDDTTDMKVKKIMERHNQRNQRKRKTTICHAEKDKVVEHSDGIQKQKRQGKKFLRIMLQE